MSDHSTGHDEEEVLEEIVEPARESGQHDFPCGQCGAQMAWDPEADALACDYCGHTQPVPRAEVGIQEYALEDAGSAARGLGVAMRVSKCGNCGAQVTFDDAATSASCVFCGSANVLEQEANRNAIRPESLVPMDVGDARIRESFKTWIRKLWFRPSDLRKTREFHAVGVYVPYWTFDCDVHSNWSADSGTYYYVTVTKRVMQDGKWTTVTSRERRVRWRPAWGDRRDAFDDLLVNASRAVPDDLARRLGGFDTSGLVPYRPEYLAGWRAEEYRFDLETGWETGRAQVRRIQEQRCAGDVPGDTHRNLRVLTTFSEVRWKHVLLPVWTLTYRYRGKTYPVLINGQTGRVVGKAPFSWLKIAALVVTIAAIVGLVVVAMQASRG